MYYRFQLLASTMTIFAIAVRGFSPLTRVGQRAAIGSPHLCAIIHDNKSTRVFSTKDKDDAIQEKSIPPMTLLAGFLGSGKTTTLQNMLNNKDGIKIGVVVNDVASVNIDSKLLSNPNNVIGGEETVELQNGCACCSLADELLTTIEELTNNGERDLDHIIIELSGVADPVAVKNNWQGAEMMGHPATKLARMDKVVTLVDSSTFGTDWMTWDTSGERDGWVDPNDDCAAQKMVPELLSEQIEAADVIVINKVDLAGEEQVKVATNLVKALNDKAITFEVNYGEISVKDVIGALSVPTKKDTDDTACDDPTCDDPTHEHAHSHDHGDCSDPTCDDPSHDHSHSEDNGEPCADSTCNDPTHDHSHSHDHGEPCADSTCNDPTHDHSHSHDHGEPCNDSTCDDPTHDHSHSHDHGTSADKLGITNFVYKRDRPFNAIRLLGVLHSWPVPVKEELDLELLIEAGEDGVSIDGKEEKSPFVGVLRSKGFCWMAPTKWTGPAQDIWRHDTAMFWSHAGKHFGVSTAGKWWGTISKDQMKGFFANNEKEYERIMDEDFVSEEFGDRRQEIVFIGAGISENVISDALDECLCTDEEMEMYRQEVANFKQAAFTKPAAATKTYQAVSPPGEQDDGGPSLFDVGGTDNIDVNIRGD